MYTRCPSCRSEISFEPPANMENLPDGYKHRIKCPSCGVTIGVKINKVDTSVTQPTYVPQNPQATNYEPVYNAGRADAVSAKRQKAVSSKKSGIPRNIFMMIIALIFIGLTIVGFLINNGTITTNEGQEWVAQIIKFSGIDQWKCVVDNKDTFVAMFQEMNAETGEAAISVQSVFIGIATISPMIVFTLSCISFIIAFICACCKKYGRIYNLIISLVIGVFACLMLFIPYIEINMEAMAAGTEQIGIANYFKDVVIGQQMYFLIVSAGLGLIQFIFSLIFLKSLKKKRA